MVYFKRAEFWHTTVYEDGGISGGTLERPSLQRLLAEQVVIYKVDRLTRCLADFAKLVERLKMLGPTAQICSQNSQDP